MMLVMVYIMYMLIVGLQLQNVNCGRHYPKHKSWMLELP